MKRRIYKDGKFLEICDPEDLAEMVLGTLNFYREEMEDAREKAAKTREDVAKDIRNEHEEENELLKQQLKFSIASVASEKELKDYIDFVNTHIMRHQTKATGGTLPIIKQHATGIGICTKLVCPVCNEEWDITDISVW